MYTYVYEHTCACTYLGTYVCICLYILTAKNTVLNSTRKSLSLLMKLYKSKPPPVKASEGLALVLSVISITLYMTSMLVHA